MTKRNFVLVAVWFVCSAFNVSAQLSFPPARLDFSIQQDVESVSEMKHKIRHNHASKRIRPTELDRKENREFLKEPKTGITRLVFAVPCSMSQKEQRSDRNKFAKECPTQYLAGNGSNFSFRKSDYVSPIQADITIKGKIIYSMGALSHGIMVKLGNVPIDEISLQSKSVKFLTDFVPAKTVAEADTQLRSFNKGRQNGEYFYASGFRLDENCTFALRVIEYRANPPQSEGAGVVLINLDPLFGDDHDQRKDIIVVFRIIKVEQDGSVTLIWKELQRKDSPILTVDK